MASRGWYQEKMDKIRKDNVRRNKEAQAISAIDAGKAAGFGPKPAFSGNDLLISMMKAAGITYVLVNGRKCAI